jgi:hypothetical protein
MGGKPGHVLLQLNSGIFQGFTETNHLGDSLAFWSLAISLSSIFRSTPATKHKFVTILSDWLRWTEVEGLEKSPQNLGG